ncbi:putative processing peptidase [Helianthus annuus]|nr:putative processing peptidase [Helianthus annuus]
MLIEALTSTCKPDIVRRKREDASDIKPAKHLTQKKWLKKHLVWSYADDEENVFRVSDDDIATISVLSWVLCFALQTSKGGYCSSVRLSGIALKEDKEPQDESKGPPTDLVKDEARDDGSSVDNDGSAHVSVDNLVFFMESDALGHGVMYHKRGYESLISVVRTIALEEVNSIGTHVLAHNYVKEPIEPDAKTLETKGVAVLGG